MSKFKSLDELYKKYSWRSFVKFKAIANRNGFDNDKEIREFLSSKSVHDERVEKPSEMLSIFSQSKGGYNMDTFIQSHSLPFLIVVNINTRKAYAYEMKNKGANEVLKALNKFKSTVGNISSITSDEDAAYLSNQVLTFMKSNSIDYRTTEDNNHNNLGIINRFMRTLRDLNNGENFTNERMQEVVDEYNESPHRALDNKTPNSMSEEDEDNYINLKIASMNTIEESCKFKKGEHVRVVLDKSKIGKNRSNLSTYAYIVDERDGKQYIIKALDDSIDKYPAYRLVRCDERYRVAPTIKNGKRGIVEKIVSYNTKGNKYKVQYEGGVIDEIPARNLREGRPTTLSKMELKYWSNMKSVPIEIRKWWK